MSLDDELPPLVAHKREREYHDKHEFEDWLVQEDCESEAAAEAHWQGVFRQMPDHIRDVHWDQRPGIDPRLFGAAS